MVRELNQNDSKICAHCGRTFSYRKKWEDCWQEIRYCSRACRREAGSRRALDLEHLILDLLKERGKEKSICPSEAARKLNPENWRSLMNETRHAARRLARSGKIRIQKKGQPIDPDEMRGPVRLSRCLDH